MEDVKVRDESFEVPICLGVYMFARSALGWTPPQKLSRDCELRTSFLRIQSIAQTQRILSISGKEQLKRIEQWTDCTMYSFRQSQGYGWVVAIVGPRDRTWEAEALVKKLGNGEVIE